MHPQTSCNACAVAGPAVWMIITPNADAFATRPSVDFKLARFERWKTVHETSFHVCPPVSPPTWAGLGIGKGKDFTSTAPARRTFFITSHRHGGLTARGREWHTALRQIAYDHTDDSIRCYAGSIRPCGRWHTMFLPAASDATRGRA